MENLWKSFNNYVWIEGFLSILWSSITCTVDWQLSCPKTGASFCEPIDLTRRSLVARAEVAPRLLPARPVLHPCPRGCHSSRVNAPAKMDIHLGDVQMARR